MADGTTALLHHAILVAWHMVAEAQPSVLAHVRRCVFAFHSHVAGLTEGYFFQFFFGHTSALLIVILQSLHQANLWNRAITARAIILAPVWLTILYHVAQIFGVAVR